MSGSVIYHMYFYCTDQLGRTLQGKAVKLFYCLLETAALKLPHLVSALLMCLVTQKTMSHSGALETEFHLFSFPIIIFHSSIYPPNR